MIWQNYHCTRISLIGIDKNLPSAENWSFFSAVWNSWNNENVYFSQKSFPTFYYNKITFCLLFVRRFIKILSSTGITWQTTRFYNKRVQWRTLTEKFCFMKKLRLKNRCQFKRMTFHSNDLEMAHQWLSTQSTHIENPNNSSFWRNVAHFLVKPTNSNPT